jgi:hypothetical protein
MDSSASAYSSVMPMIIFQLDQKPMMRIISVPPRVALIADSSLQNLTVGQRLDIHCEAEGFPPPHVSWSKQVRRPRTALSRSMLIFALYSPSALQYLTPVSLLLSSWMPAWTGSKWFLSLERLVMQSQYNSCPGIKLSSFYREIIVHGTVT